MTKTYIITEPYDDSHVRILASARTPEAAERQYDRQARARRAKGYLFFSPIRYVIGRRAEVDNHARPRRCHTPNVELRNG